MPHPSNLPWKGELTYTNFNFHPDGYGSDAKSTITAMPSVEHRLYTITQNPLDVRPSWVMVTELFS